MKYKILNISKGQEEENLITKVEFDFDGDKIEVDILHTMPKDKETIEKTIEKRAISEKRRLKEIKKNSELMLLIEINKEVILEID